MEYDSARLGYVVILEKCNWERGCYRWSTVTVSSKYVGGDKKIILLLNNEKVKIIESEYNDLKSQKLCSN